MALFIGERLFPAVNTLKQQKSYLRVIKNLSLWVCNSCAAPFIILPLTLYAASLGLTWRSGWLQGWAGITFDILVLDLWIYWWHRANHRISLLWRFHQVHHLDQWLDVSSAVRFHLGEVVLSAIARSVIIVLLGIPIMSVIIFEALILLCAGFHHSNIFLPRRFEQILSKVIVTPAIHWVHHQVDQSNTDSNYSTVFSFWDYLFNSVSMLKRHGSMKIGIGKRRDKSLIQLFWVPFEQTSFRRT